MKAIKKLFFQFSILIIFLAACNDLKTEVDMKTISFSPKLSVTAQLNGGSGNFGIWLREGRSLADYVEPLPNFREIIRQGEIRLYEDDKLILSESGEFDMSITKREDYSYDSVEKDGYVYTATDIHTRPGSVYRLEVEVEGYPMVTSTAVMPVSPVASATINPDDEVTKNNVIDLSLYGYQIREAGRSFFYWPVSIYLADIEPGLRYYYTLEIYCIARQKIPSENEFGKASIISSAIGATDLSILQDNPEIESLDILKNPITVDLYSFGTLVLSDLTFSEKAPLTFYTNSHSDYYMYNPNANKPDYEISSTGHYTIILRVKHIAPTTFRYYRSLTRQNAGVGFFTEPALIFGNIVNGYGEFSVYNEVTVTLLDWIYDFWYCPSCAHNPFPG